MFLTLHPDWISHQWLRLLVLWIVSVLIRESKVQETEKRLGYGVRYAAACETNGRRVEMLTTANIRSMVLPLVRNWIVGPGQGRLPDHVYYFRDGVSEGQFQHVLQQEVHDMKVAFQEKVHNWVVSIC